MYCSLGMLMASQDDMPELEESKPAESVADGGKKIEEVK